MVHSHSGHMEVTAPSSQTLPSNQPTSMNRVVAACMIGNALEWYDFAIYGFFAEIIGRQFFPSSSGSAQILMSLMIFAAGFLARPIGAILFGRIGDKTSRKDALMYSIYLMAIPTFLIGCWPPYAWIGITAPLGLVVLRVLQGIAIGGEFTGSIVFLVEHAEKNKRGMAGSWAAFSLIAGVLLGSGVATLFSYMLAPEELEAWGWRVPFLLSIVGSIIGGYIRRNLVDPKVYLEQKKTLKRMNMRQLFREEVRGIGIVICLDFLTAVGFFMLAIFMPLFFKNFLYLPAHAVQLIHTLNMCLFAVATLCGGMIADRINPLHGIFWPCLGFVVGSVPLFEALVKAPTLALACTVESIFCVLMGWFFGTLPSLLCNIFPTATRFSGVSIGHNLSMAIFGGTAPYAATYLITETGNNLVAPAWMLVAAALMTGLSIKWVKQFRSDW